MWKPPHRWKLCKPRFGTPDLHPMDGEWGGGHLHIHVWFCKTPLPSIPTSPSRPPSPPTRVVAASAPNPNPQPAAARAAPWIRPLGSVGPSCAAAPRSAGPNCVAASHCSSSCRAPAQLGSGEPSVGASPLFAPRSPGEGMGGGRRAARKQRWSARVHRCTGFTTSFPLSLLCSAADSCAWMCGADCCDAKMPEHVQCQ
jgi:hypothetical protein